MAEVETCHYVQDPETGLWVHIPKCWAAVHNPGQCTCDIPGSVLERALTAQEEAEAYAERLREKLVNSVARRESLLCQNVSLRHRVAELKKSLAEKETPCP